MSFSSLITLDESGMQELKSVSSASRRFGVKIVSSVICSLLSPADLEDNYVFSLYLLVYIIMIRFISEQFRLLLYNNLTKRFLDD